MSHFEGLDSNDSMGLHELFQNPTDSPDGAGLYDSPGEVDEDVLDWAISFGGLIDGDITQDAQAADGAQGVIHGNPGTQDSQEAQDVKYTPNSPDTPDTQDVQCAQDAQGTSLNATLDAADISVLAGLHTTDDVFGPQHAPFDVIASAQNGSQENLALNNEAGDGLNSHGGAADGFNGVALGYCGSTTGPRTGSIPPADLHSAQMSAIKSEGSSTESPVDHNLFRRPTQHVESSHTDGRENALGEQTVLPDVGLHEPTVPMRTFDIGLLLDPARNGMDTATWFSSVEESKQSITPRPRVSLNDLTIPRTSEQKKAIVRAICTAITSVQRSEDSDAVIRPFVEGRYSSVRIEIAAWTVLDACISRHENGPLTAPYGTKAKGSSRLENFAERMSKVLHCIETRKTVCKHLLDPPYVFNLVDDPVDFEKRIISNKNLNIRKGRAIKLGAEALKNKKNEGDKEDKENRDSNGAQSDDPYSTPEKQTLPPSRVLSPASAARRGIGAVNLSSSPQVSPDTNYGDPFREPGIIGESGFIAIPNLRDVPPIIDHPSIPPLPGTGNSYPPQLNGAGFDANTHGFSVPPTSRPGPMAPPQRLRGSSLASTSQCLPMATPTKALPSSTPASRKRGSSQVDFVATGSPEKRKQR